VGAEALARLRALEDLGALDADATKDGEPEQLLVSVRRPLVSRGAVFAV
jgi:hypothetical protein